VASIDDRQLGDGEPGPLTRRLRKRFAEVSAGRDPAFAHWLTPVTPVAAGG
jgi:branched-chain amino acid aminotransferase